MGHYFCLGSGSFKDIFCTQKLRMHSAPTGRKTCSKPPKIEFSELDSFEVVSGVHGESEYHRKRMNLEKCRFSSFLWYFWPFSSGQGPQMAIFGQFFRKYRKKWPKIEKREKWGNTRGNYSYSASHSNLPYSPVGVPICTAIEVHFSSSVIFGWYVHWLVTCLRNPATPESQ